MRVLRGVTEARRGYLKVGSSSYGFDIQCDRDRSVSSNDLYRVASDHMIGELV